VIRTMRPNVEQSSRDLLEDLALPRVDDQPTAEARQRSYQKVAAASFWKTCSA